MTTDEILNHLEAYYLGKAIKVNKEIADIDFKTLLEGKELVKCINCAATQIEEGYFLLELEVVRFGIEESVIIKDYQRIGVGSFIKYCKGQYMRLVVK